MASVEAIVPKTLLRSLVPLLFCFVFVLSILADRGVHPLDVFPGLDPRGIDGGWSWFQLLQRLAKSAVSLAVLFASQLAEREGSPSGLLVSDILFKIHGYSIALPILYFVCLTTRSKHQQVVPGRGDKIRHTTKGRHAKTIACKQTEEDAGTR